MAEASEKLLASLTSSTNTPTKTAFGIGGPPVETNTPTKTSCVVGVPPVETSPTSSTNAPTKTSMSSGVPVVGGKSHSKRIGNLLETGFRSDLILSLGKYKEEIKVHKIFLQLGSKVLDSKIEMCGGAERLELEDVEDVKSFKMMLKYFYTGTSGATIIEALPLLKMATAFEVGDLKAMCSILLNRKITEGNVLPLFEEAMKFARKHLINSTLKFICAQARRVLKLQQFCDLRLECLIEIIKQDGLQARNETEVFDAVYHWAEAECIRQNLDPSNNDVMRKIIDEPLNYVRLPLMDKEDFALRVASKKLLSSDEAMDVVLCLLVSPEKRSLLPHGRFTSKTRKYFTSIVNGQISRRGFFNAATPLTVEKATWFWESVQLTLDSEHALNLKEIVFPKDIFNISDATDTSGNVSWTGGCGHPHYFRTPCKVKILLISGSGVSDSFKEVSEPLQRKEDGSYWVPFTALLTPSIGLWIYVVFACTSVCRRYDDETNCTYSESCDAVQQQVTNFANFPVIMDKDGGCLPIGSCHSDIKVRLEPDDPDDPDMPITTGFIQHFIFDLKD